MKTSNRKTITAIILHLTFMLILVFVFLFDRNNFIETLKILCTPILINGLGYGSLRVLNAWQKSSNYNWQQDENMVSENTKKNEINNNAGITG